MRESNLDLENSLYNNDIVIHKIKMVMKNRGINARELAIKAEVGKSFVYDILSGKSSNPTAARLMSIAKALKVPLTYLLQSEDMDPNDYFDDLSYIPIFNILEDSKSCQNPSHSVRETKKPQFFLRREVLGFFLSGIIDSKGLCLYTMQGDHMQDTFFNGDRLIINTNDRHPYPSGIFVVKDSVGVVVKRLQFLANNPKMINVISDSEKYENYTCSINEIEILGKVIWYSRAV